MTTELAAYASEIFGHQETVPDDDLPVLFVAPLGDSVPDDGVFEYTTINNLLDIHNVKEQSVILFSEDQGPMLKVLAGHCALFGRSIQPLFGAPNSTYNVWFDDAVFGRERVAYGAFVAEWRAAKEINDQMRASSRSGTDIERDRFSKASGVVRYNQDITAAGDDSDVDE